MKLQKGDCVTSLKGHDAGSVCYVVGIAEGFVYLADGKHRRIDAPKKKREKHVSPAGRWAHPVTDRLTRGEPVLDSEIRRALAAFRDTFSETKEV